MKKYLNVIFAALLVLAFMPACNGGGEGDADVEVTPDPPTEDIVHEDLAQDDVAHEDAPGDPPADEQLAEQEVIEDTPEEEPAACPADDPPGEIYIDVSGTVTSIDPAVPVDGMLVAAISPLDALINPTPTHLMEDTVAADGTFTFHCLNAGGVDLGLVVLADDSGAGTTWYSTGTGVVAWADDSEKVDLAGAAVFAVTETVATGIEGMTGMNFDTTGVAMGLVVNGTTGNPIDGAVVMRSGAGTPLNLVYPNAAMTGLETDGNTSVNGSYIITDDLPTITYVTASATGFTFGVGQAATKDGFIYFLVFAGTP